MYFLLIHIIRNAHAQVMEATLNSLLNICYTCVTCYMDLLLLYMPYPWRVWLWTLKF